MVSAVVRPGLFSAALPLILALTGCGPNVTGIWRITLWEVEGAANDSVSDVGWIDIQDDPLPSADLLMRYQWKAPAGLTPYPVPQVASPPFTFYKEETLDFRSTWLFEEEVVFTATRVRDQSMIWEAEGYPEGSLSRWSLERY